MRSLCKEAIRFYAEELMGSKLLQNIKIFLVFEDLPHKYNGLCSWEDDNHRCRSFVVILNKRLNKKTVLLALAHEMVHVKQFATGELKDYLCRNEVRWKDKKFSKNRYWSSPWEKQAYRKDKKLYEKFKQRNR